MVVKCKDQVGRIKAASPAIDSTIHLKPAAGTGTVREKGAFRNRQAFKLRLRAVKPGHTQRRAARRATAPHQISADHVGQHELRRQGPAAALQDVVDQGAIERWEVVVPKRDLTTRCAAMKAVVQPHGREADRTACKYTGICYYVYSELPFNLLEKITI